MFGILRIGLRAIIGPCAARGKTSPGASAQLYHASRVFVGVAIFCGAGFSLHLESRLKPAPQELPPNLAAPVFPSARLLFSLRNALIKLLAHFFTGVAMTFLDGARDTEVECAKYF